MGILDTVVKPISDIINGTIEKVVGDKSQREKLKGELDQKLADNIPELIEHELESRKQIIISESTGSPIQKSWRPALMYVVIFLVAHNHILYPYLRIIWPDAPMLEIPPDLWDLMTLGVGGYVVGRSAEKSVKVWREKNADH